MRKKGIKIWTLVLTLLLEEFGFISKLQRQENRTSNEMQDYSIYYIYYWKATSLSVILV